MLAESKDLFKTAVSVAPVTDWRYYDTAYAERYMRIPSKEVRGDTFFPYFVQILYDNICIRTSRLKIVKVEC